MPNCYMFDQIYDAALQKNSELLPHSHDRDLIDSSKGDFGLTPAAQLAFEGKLDAAEWLIDRGANINNVAFYAAKGGHTEFSEKLQKKGANIDLVVLGRRMLRQGNYLLRLKKHFGFPEPLAMASASTDSQQSSDDPAQTKTNSGALLMLAAAACFQNPYPLSKDEDANDIQITLPPELWHRIFEFVFECDLSQKDLQQLGFLTGRLILLNQVSDYQENDALKKEILKRTNVRELRDFVSSKKERDDNDAASTSIAPLQTIFKRWHERLKPNADDTESSSASVTPG